MGRCLRIMVKIEKWKDSWSSDIQKNAKKFEVEGVLQSAGSGMLKIVACSKNDELDDFVDFLYDFLSTAGAEVEELEPFIKERDYRGIFRVI